MTVRTALLEGSKLLEDGAIAAPRLTAEVLLAHALRRERSYLYGHPEEDLADVARIHFGRYLHERLQGKPTQYITRRQEFYGRDFTVSPDVLIPRPETELVVDAALKRCGAGLRAVDVGCGSGAIAVTLALETGARLAATDVSRAALGVAAANAARLGAPVGFLQCDVLAAVRDGSADLVVSNPPYVAQADRPGLQREVRDWEPAVALFAGPTGFELYQRLVAEASRVLNPGGFLVLELGFRSLERVQALLDRRWSEIETIADLAGLPRVLAARWSP